MSNIVKNVALFALLTKSVDSCKLVQKSLMSLDELKPYRPDDLSFVQSEFLTFSQSDAMDLDDEPKEFVAAAPVPPKNNGTLVQKTDN